MNTTASAPTKNERLLAWVQEMAALTKPDDDPLVRRLGRGVRRALPAARGRGHLREALGRQAARTRTSRCSDPGRRRARRGPHVHLLRARGRRGPDEQLGRPRGDARDADRPVRRLDARAHDVRRAVLDGPARLATSATSASAHRLRLRRGEHADHDPDGRRRARGARRGRRLRPVPALGRHAARPTAQRTSRGRATRRTSTSSTSPRRARSGRTARATAATRCSARSASRCGSPR